MSSVCLSQVAVLSPVQTLQRPDPWCLQEVLQLLRQPICLVSVCSLGLEEFSSLGLEEFSSLGLEEFSSLGLGQQHDTCPNGERELDREKKHKRDRFRGALRQVQKQKLE